MRSVLCRRRTQAAMVAAAGLAGAAGAAAVPPAVPSAIIVIAGATEQGGVVRGTVPPGTTALTADGVTVPFDPDGRFILGFGRDAAPTSRLAATLADGGIVMRALSVTPRAWRVQALPGLARVPVPTADFLARRPAELAAIAAARALRLPGNGWHGAFLWPVTGRISGVFGSQRSYAGEPGAVHAGVDIARPTGTVVHAPADGTVVLAAATPFTLEGRLLILDHGAGVNSAFLHLSRIDVAVRQAVRQGQVVGAIGTTGRSTGPHLHWAVSVRDQRIDPARLAGAIPVGG